MKDKPLLTQNELKQKYDNVKVGQVWKCVENNNVVLVSLVLTKEVRGYLYDGFEVVPFICMAPLDFVRYYYPIYDPHKKKGSLPLPFPG